MYQHCISYYYFSLYNVLSSACWHDTDINTITGAIGNVSRTDHEAALQIEIELIMQNEKLSFIMVILEISLQLIIWQSC